MQSFFETKRGLIDHKCSLPNRNVHMTKKIAISFLFALASLPIATIVDASSAEPTSLPVKGTTLLKPPEESESLVKKLFIQESHGKANGQRREPDTANTQTDAHAYADAYRSKPSAPAKSKFLNPTSPRILVPNDSHVEFAGHTIGDSHRSSKSSQSFFASVDLDGDGHILKPELSQFLAQMIGGSAFDEDKEIENEVGTIFDKLDLEGDGKLEIGDVQSYWEKLVNLLTVDEVAEWIVHAGQLPTQVGEIFRENHVTGYDFAELVDNDGAALKEELKIDKATYRKRITRAVNTRLFGIGTVPSPVEDITGSVESCSTITLHWEKAQAANLPVHKYRVMRRKIGGEIRGTPKPRNHSNSSTDRAGTVEAPDISTAEGDVQDLDDNVFGDYGSGALVKASTGLKQDFGSCDLPNIKFDSDIMVHSASGWKLVYDGSEQECVDGALEPGKGYIYRIQAWNLVGKSPWSMLDPADEWTNHGCQLIQGGNGHESTTNTRAYNLLNTTKTESQRQPFFGKFCRSVAAWAKFLVNTVMTLAALSTALMRYRRSTITSTAAKLEPLTPWLFRRIHHFFFENCGISIVPESFMMENYETLNQNDHDNAMKLVGLDGYITPNTARHSSSERPVTVRKPPVHDLRRFQSEPNLQSLLQPKNLQPNEDKGKLVKKSGPFARMRSPKGQMGQMGKANISVSAHAPEYCESIGNPMASVPEEPIIHIETSEQPVPPISTVPSKRGRFMRKSSKFAAESKALHISDSASFGEAPTSFHSSYPVQTFVMKNHTISFDSSEADTHMPKPSYEEDHNICNTCNKKYKFRKRCRHLCAKCGSTFCHKHGKTTHSNMIACKVPGTCVCNVCLGVN